MPQEAEASDCENPKQLVTNESACFTLQPHQRLEIRPGALYMPFRLPSFTKKATPKWTLTSGLTVRIAEQLLDSYTKSLRRDKHLKRDADVSITKTATLKRFFENSRPERVVHYSGCTDDGAEEQQDSNRLEEDKHTLQGGDKSNKRAHTEEEEATILSSKKTKVSNVTENETLDRGKSAKTTKTKTDCTTETCSETSGNTRKTTEQIVTTITTTITAK